MDELQDLAEDFSDALREDIGILLDTCYPVMRSFPVPYIDYAPNGCGNGYAQAFMELLNSIERNLEAIERLERERRIRERQGQGRSQPRNSGGGQNGYIIGLPFPGESLPGQGGAPPPSGLCQRPIIFYNPDGSVSHIQYEIVPCK
jgi:hypothetical protein